VALRFAWSPGQAASPRSRLPKFRIVGQQPKRPSRPDDIPLAVRSQRGAYRKPPSRWPFPLWAGLCGLIVLGAGGALMVGPWRWFPQPPPPVPGLAARLSVDGRLLGHFPYPEAKPSQLVAVAPGLTLRPDAAQHFLAMQRAAAADGVGLVLLSAFRSIDLQQQLFFAVKAQRNQTALDRAKVSAPPGFSEHSTGYALDLGDVRQPQANLSYAFTETEAYRWLLNNAARYQFTLSFPQGNRQGVSFEPWHWRYEGSVEALRLFEPAQRLSRSSNP
jgi:D-alanyl-D-alanine carboxypeptidase